MASCIKNMLFKTLFDILEAWFKVKRFFLLWCLCCNDVQMDPKQSGIQRFWNLCHHYKTVHLWLIITTNYLVPMVYSYTSLGKWEKVNPVTLLLKHKYSFGKSENLSKIFFHRNSSIWSWLWRQVIEQYWFALNLFYFFKNNLFEYFLNCSEGLRTNLYTLSTILCKV